MDIRRSSVTQHWGRSQRPPGRDISAAATPAGRRGELHEPPETNHLTEATQMIKLIRVLT